MGPRVQSSDVQSPGVQSSRVEECSRPESKGITEFLDSGRKSWTLDFGLWTLDAGLWKHDPGRWTLDSGRWALDAELWTLDSGRWTLLFTNNTLCERKCSTELLVFSKVFLKILQI